MKKTILTSVLVLVVSSLVFIVTLLSVAYIQDREHSEKLSGSKSWESERAIKSQPASVKELLRLVNAERKKADVKPLILDSRLNESAQFKADDMVNRDYFEHEDPQTGRHNGLDKAVELGVGADCESVSENLHWGSEKTSKAAVNGWVNSKDHYKAMVNPKYSLTGFGISGDKVVEHFC